MNLLRIKYFIDVANFNSFTKAAQNNYVSQTAVSQQIAALERELEVTLFTRGKGKVALTPAGEIFYQHCIHMLAEYENAVVKARIAQSESGGVITLGIIASCRMGYMYKIFNNFKARYPNIDIKLVHGSFAGLRSQLELEKLDVVLCVTYNGQGNEIVEVEHMTRVKIGLLVSRLNPLSKYDEINANMVENLDVVVTSRNFMGEVYDHMIDQRRMEGFVPNIVETADSVEILTMLVEMNRGVAYLPETLTKYNNKLCKMLHISDNEDYMDMSLFWRKQNDNQPIQAFIQCVREFFHTEFDDWLKENDHS